MFVVSLNCQNRNIHQFGVTEPLTVHFFHGFDEILRIFEADKSKTFGFVCTFVSHDLGLQKRWVLVESTD